MVGKKTDMAEHPNDILRALADPERLRIAGVLAAGDSDAATLAGALDLPLPRVRRHLVRLAAAGVARLQPDRRTRLDPETLRWAAEQVGPPRDAGISLAAANEDEEAVLRAFFRDGRLAEVPTKASKRRIVLGARGARVRAGSALRRARGERDRRHVLQRPRAAPSVPRRRGVPRSRRGRLLESRRPGRRLSSG